MSLTTSRSGAIISLRPFTATPARSHVATNRYPTVVLKAGKDSNFGDELLDFMYAGKKLRKWYGEEGMVLPKDGRDDDEEDPKPELEDDYSGPRDHILVLDIDTSAMAEQVLLQLILSRAATKVLAKDVEAARKGFQPYTDVLANNTDPQKLRRSLQNVAAVVSCSKLSPQLLDTLKRAGVPRIVLLSMLGSQSSGFSLFGGGEVSVLTDGQREKMAMASGIPVTTVRVSKLLDAPGGESELTIAPAGEGSSGTGGAVSREDCAKVLAEAALYSTRDNGSNSLTISVSAKGPGQTAVGEAVASLFAS